MSIISILGNKGTEVFSINVNATVRECIAALNQHRIGALMVVDSNNTPQGIVSERDVLHCAFKNDGKIMDIPVREIMTPSQFLITSDKDDSIEEIMQQMTNHRIRHMPIIADGHVVGMISIGDIVKTLLNEVMKENEHLRDYISGRYAANF